MWRTPRGREWARRHAFRDLTYAESARAPAFLVVSEAIRQQISADPLTKEQDDLIWQLVEGFYFAYLEDPDGAAEQLVPLAATWFGKGSPTILAHAWQSVAPKLKSSVRGPVAYVFGLRYRLKLKKPAKETAVFFQTALADAPPESALRLAQEELDRPGEK